MTIFDTISDYRDAKKEELNSIVIFSDKALKEEKNLRNTDYDSFLRHYTPNKKAARDTLDRYLRNK
jgi:hypothetical protein